MFSQRFVFRCAVFFAVVWPLLHAPRLHAEAAAFTISDTTSGVILESTNPTKKLQVGSLTKIATAMVVLDWAGAKNGDLTQLATVPESAVALNNPNGVGLRPGEQVSLRDLLYAALMQSDNAAAETLASHVGRALGGGTEQVSAVTWFVAQMNALARRLGMAGTLFLNPHGLDGLERKQPYSTAHDMALLANYAMRNSGFRFYVSQSERKITVHQAGGDQSGYLLRNTNELLDVNGIDGVKTGTTRKAGPCVIISAARAPESRQEGEKHFITPRRLTVVVLGAADRFELAKELLARGWQLHERWAAAGRPEKSGAKR